MISNDSFSPKWKPALTVARPSTALASDPQAGLGFKTKIHKAYFYNNDASRPKIFLNLIENKIDLKMVKKRDQSDNTIANE